MAPLSRILWPAHKPLAQLVGAKLAQPQNGNGHGKKSLTLPISKYWLDGNPEYFGEVDTPGLNRYVRGFDAYALSALAYACMRFRSQKLIEAPLWIAEETEDGDEWVDDHELSEVLEQPNPDMEMSDLLECLSLYMDVTGRALLVKTRDRGNRVAQLYPFSGDEFTVEQANGRLYGRFRVNTSQGTRTLAPEDVIFFKDTDPRNPIDGLGPLSAALAHINIGDQMRRSVQALLRNQVKPGAIFLFPNGFADETEQERFIAEARSNFAGVQNTGRSMFVTGTDKEPKLLDSNLNNLAFGPVQDDVEATVCSAFEVHPVLVHTKLGLTANSGLADTMKPALELFYDRFFFPTTAKIEKTLTRSLLREVDPDTNRYIRFDTSKIRALQEDRGDKISEAKNAQGIWSLNEQRVHTGQEAIDDPQGDEIRAVTAIQLNPEGAAKSSFQIPTPTVSQPLRVHDSAKSPSAPVDTEKKIEAKRDARLRLWRKFDVKATREESRYEREAQEQFAHEKAAIVALFEGSSDAHIRTALEKLKAAYLRKDGEYHLQWIKRYTKLISETFNASGQDLAAEIGFDFSLENPKVQFAIRNRANKLSGNVTRTTYESIQDAVSKGRAEGDGVGSIAKRIREDVFGGEITKSRATTIARTETIGALNEGEMIAAQESGVIRSKEWLSQGDSKVRDGHDIDGEVVSVDAQFSNGLEYPGDQRGTADNVINCRCTVLYSDEEAA